MTSRERPKSASYLRLKNIQETTIRNTWKKNNFQKKYLVKMSHIPEKHKKRPFRLIKQILQTENFQKFKGVLFDRIQKFSGKCIVPKKNRKGHFGLNYTFGGMKICGLVRESNPHYPASKAPENWSG